jgi:hypothetical protein
MRRGIISNHRAAAAGSAGVKISVVKLQVGGQLTKKTVRGEKAKSAD